MQHNEEFFVTRKKSVSKLMHFLEECKYSGSLDTKVDINLVIKTMAQDDFLIDELRTEVKRLELLLKSFEVKPEQPSEKLKKEAGNIKIK
jgi:hypothetical protein